MAINIDYGAGRGMAGMYQNLLNIQQEGQRQLAEKERHKTEQMQGLFQAAGGFLGRREQARQAEAAGAFQQQGQQAIKSAEQDYLAGLEKYDASIEAAGSPEAKAAAYRDKELYTQSYQDRINAINQQIAERQKAFSESGFLGIGRDTNLLGGGFKDLPSMYAPESATAAQQAAVAARQQDLTEAEKKAILASQMEGEAESGDAEMAKQVFENAIAARTQARDIDARRQYGASRFAGEQIDLAKAGLSQAKDVAAQREQDLMNAQLRRHRNLEATGYVQGIERDERRQKYLSDLEEKGNEEVQKILNESISDQTARALKLRTDLIERAGNLRAQAKSMGEPDMYEIAQAYSTGWGKRQYEENQRIKKRLLSDADEAEQKANEIDVSKITPSEDAQRRANAVKDRVLEEYDRIDSRRQGSERAGFFDTSEDRRKREAVDQRFSEQDALAKERFSRAEEAVTGAEEKLRETELSSRLATSPQRQVGPTREDVAAQRAQFNLTQAQKNADVANNNYEQLLTQQRAGKPLNAGIVTKAQQELDQAQTNLAERQREIKEGFVTLPSGRMIPKGQTAAAVAEEERLKLRDEAIADDLRDRAIDFIAESDDPVMVARYAREAGLPEEYTPLLQSVARSNEVKNAKNDEERNRRFAEGTMSMLISMGDIEGAHRFGQRSGVIPGDFKFTDQKAIEGRKTMIRNLTDPDMVRKITSNMVANGQITQDDADILIADVKGRKFNSDTERARYVASNPALSRKQRFEALKQGYPKEMKGLKFQEYENSSQELDAAVKMAQQTGQPISGTLLSNIGITDEKEQEAFNAKYRYAYDLERFQPQQKRILDELGQAITTATDDKGKFSASTAKARIDEILSNPSYADAVRFYGYDNKYFVDSLLTKQQKAIDLERTNAEKLGYEIQKLKAETTTAMNTAGGRVSPSKMLDVVAKTWTSTYNASIDNGEGPNLAAQKANSTASSLISSVKSIFSAPDGKGGDGLSGSAEFLKKEGFGGGENKGDTSAEPTTQKDTSTKPDRNRSGGFSGSRGDAPPVAAVKAFASLLGGLISPSTESRLSDKGVSYETVVSDIIAEQESSGSSFEDAAKTILNRKYVGTDKDGFPFRTAAPYYVKEFSNAAESAVKRLAESSSARSSAEQEARRLGFLEQGRK